MAETITQSEAIPAAYPDAPSGLSAKAAALDASVIWARIESYTAHRFTTREVTWLVEGEGDWTAPLTPASVTSADKWNGTEWEPCVLVVGPYGYSLASVGPYRITADVGGGTMPEPFLEAFRRLAEYVAPGHPDGILAGRPGTSSHSAKIGDNIQESYERNPAWMAKAMQYSGAADLLRPYRRA